MRTVNQINTKEYREKLLDLGFDAECKKELYNQALGLKRVIKKAAGSENPVNSMTFTWNDLECIVDALDAAINGKFKDDMKEAEHKLWCFKNRIEEKESN